MNNVIELLQALVRIPSVNPSGNPGTDFVGEARCADFVGQFLGSCGARVELQEVKPGRPNVVGTFPTDRTGKPRLVLAPHTDTVSVAGMTIEPFGGEWRDGRIYGRGATDTKGSMAAMLWALHDLRDRIPTLTHEIQFVGLMGEEAGQEGARHFVQSLRADFALIGEPTDLQIVHTHKGAIWLTLTTRGRAVHASTPQLGDNAIYKMADAIRCIRDEIAPMLDNVREPVLGSPTISVGVCSGGSKTNIVPDLCTAEADIRTVPGDDGLLESISSKLRRACPDLVVDSWEAKPLYTDPGHPLIRVLEKIGSRCVGAPWFCDAAVFADAGIPAVAAGPGNIAQAHTKDEWISIDDLQRGVDFYRSFLSRLTE
jgi:acetylornithine deacetylase/succinyl-diaminopimelate desuccinylase-like protein